MKKQEYDVIIIGAGIGGLTCGCYLAKAGMKVLIVEQHSQVGGYCTSFVRSGFTFNVLTSTLGNLGKNKAMGIIVDELGIGKKVEFMKIDPSDTIQTPEHSIPIYSNFDRTISKLQDSFPLEEQKIREFFDFIRLSDAIYLYFKLRNKSLKVLLDSYFKDTKLKSVLTMMLCRLGLHPKDISAFTSAVHLREFIMDMGYHPKGGMQNLSEAFAERVRDSGGTILLSSLVDKITIKNNKVVGVNIKEVGFVQSKYVVCACDPTKTFLDLIGTDYLEKGFVEKLTNFNTGVSGFILFLGVDKKKKNLATPTYVLSYSRRTQVYDYDPRDIDYLNSKEIDIPIHLILPSYFDESLAPNNKESIALTMFVPFINEKFWNERKSEMAEKLIMRAKDVIPDLSDNIVVENIVTPLTLRRYTFNRNGSAHGWAPILSQAENLIIEQRSFIEKLFFVGQWVTLRSGESGVPVAAYTGKIGAKMILKEEAK